MPSIKQNPAGLPVPDFRNFGVMLRVLLGVNLMAFAVALGQGGGLSDAVQRFAEQAAWVQPVLLFDLCLLALCHAPLQRLPVRLAQAAILAKPQGRCPTIPRWNPVLPMTRKRRGIPAAHSLFDEFRVLDIRLRLAPA